MTMLSMSTVAEVRGFCYNFVLLDNSWPRRWEAEWRQDWPVTRPGQLASSWHLGTRGSGGHSEDNGDHILHPPVSNHRTAHCHWCWLLTMTWWLLTTRYWPGGGIDVVSVWVRPARAENAQWLCIVALLSALSSHQLGVSSEPGSGQRKASTDQRIES